MVGEGTLILGILSISDNFHYNINTYSILLEIMRKIALFALPFFIMSPVNALEIKSVITDSVQLTVDGPVVQSTRSGSSYAVSGSNVSVTTLGGLTGGSATAAATMSAGTYDIGTDEAAFTFSESLTVGDTPVTAQAALTSGGRIEEPNIYGETTTQLGGTAGTLAGTLSGITVPTVTAGGAGTTAIGQRTIELSVFQ